MTISQVLCVWLGSTCCCSASRHSAISMGSNGSRWLDRMAYSTTSWHSSSTRSSASAGSRNTYLCPVAWSHSAATIIWFIVSVPVLSVHSTVHAPSDSIALFRRVSTLLFEIRHAPSEKNTASTTGNSSGSSPIASVIAASAPSVHSCRFSP